MLISPSSSNGICRISLVVAGVVLITGNLLASATVAQAEPSATHTAIEPAVAPASHPARLVAHRVARQARPAVIARSKPIMPAVGPAFSGDDATLTGVSCLGSALCVAAGFYIAYAEESVFGLAESSDGHGWGDQMVSGYSTKADVTDAVAVSCGALGNCMIVGEHYDNAALPVQFAELVNGTPLIWNNPAGTRWSELNDVKCVGSAFCMAVGSYSKTAAGGRVLAEDWTGSSWHRLNPPSPGQSRASGLSALYCLSATDCRAVGVRETKAKHLVSFSEYWNGRRWTLALVPDVRGQRDTELNDIACAAPGTCFAVGLTGNSLARPLIMTLSKGAWTTARTPGVDGAGLLGISCANRTNCLAVGSRGNRLLAERWNGSRWTVTAPARTGGTRPDDVLTHVSCISVSRCVAVGIRYNAKHRVSNNTLIEVWNKSVWRIQQSVNP